MSDCKHVFQRYEKKYILDQAQYSRLTGLLEGRMKEDEYGKYTIASLYLDTPDYQLIRTSIEKPVYKEKLRLRSYGVPKQDDKVFLELKKKFDGVIYKRRVDLTLREAEQYLLQGMRPNQNSQIMNELHWTVNRYQVQPMVYIAYDRIALSGLEDPELRITFDGNMRWRQESLSLGSGSWGRPIIPEKKVVMEIKTLGAMPLWLAHGLAMLEIYPGSFSKYGTCYKNHLVFSGKEGFTHAS